MEKDLCGMCEQMWNSGKFLPEFVVLLIGCTKILLKSVHLVASPPGSLSQLV